MTKRIWIIDGSYLYKSTPERFDYLRLKNELQTILGITFTESYYFNSRMPRSTPAQLSFNKWLQTAEPIGPQLIVKLFDVKRIFSRCNECQQQSERYIQKGVDVGIVTQIFKLLKRSQVERLTLCAGDSDFSSALEALNENNIQIDIAGFRETMATELQQWGNVVWVDDFWGKSKSKRAPALGYTTTKKGIIPTKKGIILAGNNDRYEIIRQYDKFNFHSCRPGAH